MDAPKLKKTGALMQALSKGIEEVLNGNTGKRQVLHSLFVWTNVEGQSPQVNYVSNADRGSIKEALQSVLDRWNSKEHKTVHEDWIGQYLGQCIKSFDGDPASSDFQRGYLSAHVEMQRVYADYKIDTIKFDFNDYLKGGKFHGNSKTSG